MFDMNKLFEEFIAEFIKREGILEGTIYQGYDQKNQHPQKYLLQEKLFKMKPDICLLKVNSIDCIIDTKYKLLNDKDQKQYGVSQSDVYQMYAYANKYKCKRIILLYPEHLSEIKSKAYKFEEGNTLEIATVNLQRDLHNEKEKENLKNKLINVLGTK